MHVDESFVKKLSLTLFRRLSAFCIALTLHLIVHSRLKEEQRIQIQVAQRHLENKLN